MTPEQIEELIAHAIIGATGPGGPTAGSLLSARRQAGRVIKALADEHLFIVGGGAEAPKPEAPERISASGIIDDPIPYTLVDPPTNEE